MAELAKFTSGEIRSGIGARLADPAAHDPFSIDTVKLAFGRSSGGRIEHVSQVARGAACDCTCPACGEALVSRQGLQKAWHFAHASGRSCKDALSAAAAAILDQQLGDGVCLLIPAATYRWGRAEVLISEPTKLAFDHTRLVRDNETGTFSVEAEIIGGHATRRILIHPKLSVSATRVGRPDVSQLEIDLGTALADLVRSGRDLTEDWLTSALVETAPRSWTRNLAAERLREDRVEKTLGRRLAAASAICADERSAETADEIVVAEFGFRDALDTPHIDGERFLGPSGRGWRAAIFMQLLLRPLLERGADLLLQDAGIDRRRILRALGQSGVVRNDELMRPMPRDDQAEFEERVPDLRPPLAVVEDYIQQLWERGYLVARRTARRARCPAGAFDDRLSAAGMPDCLPAEQVFANVAARRQVSRNT